MHSATLEKTKLKIQQERGYTDVNNPKSLKEYLKGEEKKWKFTIERKWSKENMQKSISRNNSQTSTTSMNRSKDNTNNSKSNIHSSNNLKRKLRTPLLQLSVNLDQNVKKTIEVYQYDDPYLVAEEFCKNNGKLIYNCILILLLILFIGLSEEKKIFLQKIIVQKLKDD